MLCILLHVYLFYLVHILSPWFLSLSSFQYSFKTNWSASDTSNSKWPPPLSWWCNANYIFFLEVGEGTGPYKAQCQNYFCEFLCGFLQNYGCTSAVGVLKPPSHGEEGHWRQLEMQGVLSWGGFGQSWLFQCSSSVMASGTRWGQSPQVSSLVLLLCFLSFPGQKHRAQVQGERFLKVLEGLDLIIPGVGCIQRWYFATVQVCGRDERCIRSKLRMFLLEARCRTCLQVRGSLMWWLFHCLARSHAGVGFDIKPTVLVHSA